MELQDLNNAIRKKTSMKFNSPQQLILTTMLEVPLSLNLAAVYMILKTTFTVAPASSVKCLPHTALHSCTVQRLALQLIN